MAELFRRKTGGLQSPRTSCTDVKNYELIPEPVRQAIEGLTTIERPLVTHIFNTLAENHFYLENNLGGGLVDLY